MKPSAALNLTAAVPLDKLREECGIIGIFGHPEASKLAYLGLYAQQHRGQEAAGIAAWEGQGFHLHRSLGQVAEIFPPAVLARLTGENAIGHTRYATAGDGALSNAQPLRVDCSKGPLALAHNGNLVNASALRSELEAAGSIFQTTSDTEVLLHLLARSRAADFETALNESLVRLEGAFSLVLLTRNALYAIRDPRGFRPLAWGKLENGGWTAASETCAFDLLGAEYGGEVEPGTWRRFDSHGSAVFRYAPSQPSRHCIFEHVYFSRPDSQVFGRGVQASREEMGRMLAREAPADADLIVPVPDSGVAAALGYAAESGIPFRFGLIRNHYIGRTFIEPSQQIRDFGVKLKLNPVRSLLAGQRVILVDDSIVRGTTSRKIVRMIRNAGAAEVHMRVSCPPTVSPCYYGVDTPSRKELIAATQSIEQICEYIGADSLAYLSLAGLRQAVGEEPAAPTRFCSACYTGEYPTPGLNLETAAYGRSCR